MFFSQDPKLESSFIDFTGFFCAASSGSFLSLAFFACALPDVPAETVVDDPWDDAEGFSSSALKSALLFISDDDDDDVGAPPTLLALPSPDGAAVGFEEGNSGGAAALRRSRTCSRVL